MKVCKEGCVESACRGCVCLTSLSFLCFFQNSPYDTQTIPRRVNAYMAKKMAQEEREQEEIGSPQQPDSPVVERARRRRGGKGKRGDVDFSTEEEPIVSLPRNETPEDMVLAPCLDTPAPRAAEGLPPYPYHGVSLLLAASTFANNNPADSFTFEPNTITNTIPAAGNNNNGGGNKESSAEDQSSDTPIRRNGKAAREKRATRKSSGVTVRRAERLADFYVPPLNPNHPARLSDDQVGQHAMRERVRRRYVADNDQLRHDLLRAQERIAELTMQLADKNTELAYYQTQQYNNNNLAMIAKQVMELTTATNRIEQNTGGFPMAVNDMYNQLHYPPSPLPSLEDSTTHQQVDSRANEEAQSNIINDCFGDPCSEDEADAPSSSQQRRLILNLNLPYA